MRKILAILLLAAPAFSAAQDPTSFTLSGSFRQATTSGSSATDSLIMEPVNTSVARIGVWMGTMDFFGVPDPLMFWGYNYTPVKFGHPRFYWGLEGNYYNEANGRTYSETYIERKDSGGAGSVSYRPFILGTYDGGAEAAFYTDTLNISGRPGNPGFGGFDNNGPWLIVNPLASIMAVGKGRMWLKQEANSPGVYWDLLGTDASNNVVLGNVNTGVVMPGQFLSVTEVRLRGGLTRPACDVESAGGFWRTPGSTVDPKTADSVAVCVWDGAGYGWKAIPLAGCP